MLTPKQEAQREQARLYASEYHRAHREDCLAKMRIRNAVYYQKNRDKLIAKAARYPAENGNARNSYKSAWNRAKKKSCPQFAAISIMRKLVSRTCERIKLGRREIGKTVEVLGYRTEEFRSHIELQFRDGMSWQNHGEWHVDYIKPLSKYNLTDPEQRREANALVNLQPLWAAENMAKGAR